MPTQILAVGSTNAGSADVVVGVGETLTVSLKDADGPSVRVGSIVDILLKDDAGEYFRVDTLTYHRTAVVISGSGTYRFTRRNRGNVSCGVFSG